MIKSIIFTGKPNDHSWNGTVSNSADAKFNRWMKDHEHVQIKDICYAITNENMESMCVIYDEDDKYVDHPTVLEDGIYFVDAYNGRFIMCDRNIDVTYMIKDFIKFNKLISDKGDQFIVNLKNGEFTTTYSMTNKVDKSDGGPICTTEKIYRSIDASLVIYDKYIPGYGNNGDKPECFSLHKHTGRYYIDLMNHKLIYAENNLDVSYIVSNFHMFKDLNIDVDGDYVMCIGETFMRQKLSSKDVNDATIACKDVVHDAYL